MQAVTHTSCAKSSLQAVLLHIPLSPEAEVWSPSESRPISDVLLPGPAHFCWARPTALAGACSQPSQIALRDQAWQKLLLHFLRSWCVAPACLPRDVRKYKTNRTGNIKYTSLFLTKHFTFLLVWFFNKHFWLNMVDTHGYSKFCESSINWNSLEEHELSVQPIFQVNSWIKEKIFLVLVFIREIFPCFSAFLIY